MQSYYLPTWEYYEPRLAAVWERAKSSKWFSGLGSFTPAEFNKLKNIQKNELKENPWDFVAVDLKDCTRYYETTGTTGLVTPTPRTHDDVVHNIAAVGRAWQAHIGPSDRVLSLLPSDVVPVGDLIAGVSEHLGVVHARAYPYANGICDWTRVFSLWKNFRPTVIFSAPGVMREFTKIALSRGEIGELSSSLNTAMLLGEVSANALRKRLGSWWDCSVINASYGSTETGTLAAGRLSGQLHLLPENNYFELVGEDGCSIPLVDSIPIERIQNLTGRLIVTPLNGYARPLLKYDTGDNVAIDCATDDESPSITIHGRASDQLIVGDTAFNVDELEEIVYQTTASLGYVVQLNDQNNPTRARVLLERPPESSRLHEAFEGELLVKRLQADACIDFFDVVWVNSLPTSSKSGASLKSWKTSNLRIAQW